jgi:hypothetical protein
VFGSTVIPAAPVSHAQGCNLDRRISGDAYPDTWKTIESTNATNDFFVNKLTKHIDDRLFHMGHVSRHGLRVNIDRDNRIGHDLARRVKGNVSASVGGDDFGADALWRYKYVSSIGVHTKGDDRWVLEDEDVVFVTSSEGTLEVSGFRIGDPPEVPDPQRLTHCSFDQSLVSSNSLMRARY